MTQGSGGQHFLAGGGEMGERIRSLDWAATPLGPIEGWPQSLRSAVSILLPSKAQIALFWGPELITLYNDAYRPVFGAKHPHVLGQPIREAWSELWRAGLRELFENVLGTGEAFWAKDRPFYMERHGYPEETFFDVSYDPVRDESGKVGGVFCIVSETTGRVLGERRLKVLRDLAAVPAQAASVAQACTLSLEILRSATHDVPFADIDLDGARGWRPGLQAAEALPGLLVERGPWPEAPAKALVLELPARAGGEATGAIALGVSARLPFDDEYRGFFNLVAGQVAASMASAGAAESERRRAEALAELDRAKTTFFSNVSHEFRTPLTLMLGPLADSLALPEEKVSREARELLAVAQRNGLRLHKLVNTLLDFARIEAGRAQASYEPTDLAALTADLASTFRSAVEKAGLALRLRCEPLASPAWVDRDMWEKVVLNLLSNAFKFTFEGEIEVSLREMDGAFVLAVRDTGTGIPQAELPHIFERFRRIEGARSRTHEGTGIGLALVQELVRLHGGAIEVKSTEGRGSTFLVRIPAGNAHLPADRLSAPRALPSTALGAAPFREEALQWLPEDDGGQALPAAPARGARIVWADDNADLREYVHRLLAAHYDVVAVPDGEAALAAIRARRPDLVLADVMMPKLDGFGVLAALRADPELQSIPVVLLSARAGEEARVEGLKAGADDYIAKPFSARELLARVAARLELAIARRQVEASAAELRSFADTAPAILWTTDPDGACTFLSRGWYEFTGQREDEALGLGWTQAIHPDDRSDAAERFLKASARRDPYNTDYRLRRADGAYRWVIDSGRARYDANGSFLGFVGSVIDVHERKVAEDAVRQSEERLRAIVEATPECVKLVAADGTLLQMNASGLAMVGAASPDAVIGRCIYDVIAVEHRDDFRALNEAVCRGERGTLQFDVVGLDGRRRHMETHAVPLGLQDGSCAQLAITRDITERRRAEEAMRESEARYRTIFGAAGVSIWEEDFTAVKALLDRWRADGVTDLRAYLAAHPERVREAIGQVRILDMNEASLRLFGASSKAELMQSLERIFLPETERTFAEELLALAEGRPHFEAEQAVRTLAGERLEVLVTVAFPPPGGRLDRVPATVTDITARKRAERALRESEARYRAIVESQAEMVCRFHLDGTILFANAAYARARGTTPAALTGANFWDFIPPGDHGGVRAMLQSLTPGTPEVRIENRFDTAEGTRWTLWTNRALAFDAHGRAAEVQSSGIDITERRRAEEALREADRRKDEFIATLSHELRNPLAPLRNALELLRLDGAAAGPQAELHDMMERQVSHLVRLVDDLLELSRINRGTFELRRERVDAAQVVKSALETSGPLVRAARHTLQVDLPSEPLWLDGDPVRLAQILSNVLNNAAKYTPPGGRIEVRAAREGAQVAIRVRDNGSGIAPEALPEIFEMFTRGARVERGSGLGIGLALSRRLAQMHGGTIDARSAGPGQGSEFVIRLPLSRAASAGAPASSTGARIAQRRILVVDDNRDAADTLGMLLRFMGADVHVENDGSSALRAFGRYRPEVVFLDIGMPGMDGFELARSLREDPAGREVPLVALTGWGQEADKRRTREAGFDHHLVKPAEFGALHALLAQLEEKGMRRAG